MAVRYSRFLPLATFAGDLILLNISLYCAHLLAYNYYHLTDAQSADFVLLVNFSWISITSLTKSFIIKRPLVLKENFNKFLTAFLYHLVIVLGIIYFLKLYQISRWELVLTYFIFLGLVFLQRYVLVYTLDYVRRRGYNNRQVLIVGDQTIANKLVKSFSKHPEYGYDLTDFISEDMIKNFSDADLIDKLITKNPDEIFVCYKHMDSSMMQRIVDIGDEYSIKIKLVSDLLFNLNYAEIISYDNLPVIQVSANPELSLKVRIFKRSFDILFAFLVMTVGSPVFVLLMLLTKISSKGPVFYMQERMGKNLRPFTMYKFRSMYINAELNGPQLSTDDDPRITKIGRVLRRTRLDELPQFFNVLRGDMSVVGPRPERQFFIEQLIERSPSYQRLLRIKPGITSIGQVSYGYAENIDQMRDRVRYDLIYLNNITFNAEMNIILKTVKIMIQRKGK